MQRFVVPLLIFLVTCATYVRTLLPDVGIWDTAEFQSVPRVLGIMHATGYPLYTLLGNLASWVPIGSVAYRMNLFAAVCGALACALVTWTSRRMGASDVAAAGAGVLAAMFLPLWNTATRADPHALHAVFVPLIVLVMLEWREKPTAGRLAVAGWVAGLSLSNHMQTTMLLPGLAVGVVWGRWRSLSPGAIGAGLAGLFAGLLPYLYLPLRASQNPPLDYGHPVDWPRFHALVLGEHFHQDMGFFTMKGLETFAVQAGRLPGWCFDWWGGWPALGLAVTLLAGLVALARRDRGLLAGLAVMTFLPLYWACTWLNGDVERYFIAPAELCCLVAGVGLTFLLAPLAKRQPGVALAVSLVLAVLPFAAWPTNFARADRSAEHGGREFIEAVLPKLPQNAVVYTVWLDATPLWYAHYVEGRRLDVRIFDASEIVTDFHDDMVPAIASQLGKRPVIVLRTLDDQRVLEAHFTTRSLGDTPTFHYPFLEVTGTK